MKNKMFMAFLSLAISFGLWLFVVTVVSPESVTEFESVPVEFVGANRLDKQNLMIVSDTSNLTVDLTLKGNRSDLNSLDKSDITVLVDLSQIDEPGEHQVKYTVSFRSVAAEVQAQNPEYITVNVVEQSAVTVPIKVFTAGNVAAGYSEDLTEVEMEVTTVTAKGPKDVIDKIAYAGITVDLTDRNSTIYDVFEIRLYQENGTLVINDQYISLSVDEVKAAVPIYCAKSVKLYFDSKWDEWNFAQDIVTITPTSQTVTVLGSKADLAKVKDNYTVPISMKDYTQTTVIKPDFLPEELRDYVKLKEDVAVEIKIEGLQEETVALPSSQISIINQAANLKIEVSANVDVKLIGMCEKMKSLNIEDLVILVDFSAVTGESTLTNAICTVQGHEDLIVKILWNEDPMRVSNVEG